MGRNDVIARFVDWARWIVQKIVLEALGGAVGKWDAGTAQRELDAIVAAW